MFTPLKVAPRPVRIRVTVGRRAIKATGVGDQDVSLTAIHDQVCQQLQQQAPYPIGPIHVVRMSAGLVSVDARRVEHRYDGWGVSFAAATDAGY